MGVEELLKNKKDRRNFLKLGIKFPLSLAVLSGLFKSANADFATVHEKITFSGGGVSFDDDKPPYEVYALKYASGNSWPNYIWYWMGNPAFKPNQECPTVNFYYWLIKGSKYNILFDTGVTEDVATSHHLVGYEPPAEVLKRVGLTPDNINPVIISHCHWDHANGIGFYPKATFFIQEACYNWSVEKAPQYSMMRAIHWPGKEDISALVNLNVNGQLRLVPGEQLGSEIKIMPGISVLRVDGHFHGLQSLIVETKKGQVLLPSDACYMYGNMEKNWPVGICLDRLTDALDGMARFKKILGESGILVPSHDKAIEDKFEQVKPGVYKIA